MENLSSLSIDGTPLDVLMQQAADLKTHEMARERRQFDALPVYLRNSLFVQDEALLAVQESKDFAEKRLFCSECKERGSALLREGDLLRAKREIERALSVWMYVRSDCDDWRAKPIEDKDLRHFRYEPRSEEERITISKLRHKLLLNLSLCYQQLCEYTHSRQCCDTILREIDSRCVKALYRRAQSFLLPLSCSASDTDDALRDLQTALEINPSNTAVRALFVKTSSERVRQRETERRRFGGFLDRAMLKEKEQRRGERKAEDNKESVGSEEEEDRLRCRSQSTCPPTEDTLSNLQTQASSAEHTSTQYTHTSEKPQESPRLTLGDLFHALHALENEIESLRVALTYHGEQDSDECALLMQRLSDATLRKHTIERSLRAANLNIEKLKKDFEELRKSKSKQTDSDASNSTSSPTSNGPKCFSLSPDDWDESVLRDAEALAKKLFDDCDPQTLRKMLRSRWRREQRQLSTQVQCSSSKGYSEVKICDEKEDRGLRRVEGLTHINTMPKCLLDEILRECVVRDYLHCCVLLESRFPSENDEKESSQQANAEPKEGDDKEKREFFQSLVTDCVLQYLDEETFLSLLTLPESLAFLDPLLTHVVSWFTRAVEYLERLVGVEKSSIRVFLLSFVALLLFRVVVSALVSRGVLFSAMNTSSLD